MPTLPRVRQAIQTLLTTTADHCARTSGFVQRTSKLTGAQWAQTLVFGWMSTPDATLSDLSTVAATAGVPISPQGLDDRFSPASARHMQQVLEAALDQVLAADPVPVPLLQRFSGVWVQDTTTIALPDDLADAWRGCGGNRRHTASAVKALVRIDLLRGQVQGPTLHQGRDADRALPLATAPIPAGGLKLADLGFWDVGVMAAVAADGAYVLSRLRAGTAVYDPAGTRLDVAHLLRHSPGPVDCWVWVGGKHRLRLRLVAVPVSASVAADRRRRIRREGQKKGRAPSQARLAVCEYNIYLTNVPAALLAVDDILVLARARWQVELLFKLWKSQGHIAVWRTRNRWRILTEVYAKLVAMLIKHWLFLVGCWAAPDRSLVKAAAVVSRWALHLLSVLSSQQRLTEAIERVAASMGAGCRMNRRRTHPNAYQRWLDPALGGLA
jgi:hypothetical protein